MKIDEIPTDKPFLAYTRQWGWVKVIPILHEGLRKSGYAAITNPMQCRVYARHILAVADLPPVPSVAL